MTDEARELLRQFVYGVDLVYGESDDGPPEMGWAVLDETRAKARTLLEAI